MSITRGLRWFVVLALLSSVAAASSHGADTNPPPIRSDRPSTVVVSVRDGGFHWADAGVGAAARSPRRCSRSASCWPCDQTTEATANHEALS